MDLETLLLNALGEINDGNTNAARAMLRTYWECRARGHAEPDMRPYNDEHPGGDSFASSLRTSMYPGDRP